MEKSSYLFVDEEHQEFYLQNIKKCRYQDAYHRSLIYTLGICRDARKFIKNIYEFKSGCIKPECLHEGWNTSGSVRVIRLAFNLYNNGTPTVFEYEESGKSEDALDECRRYSVSDIFCCEYAPYFMQAIKIRYPEYF